MALQQTYGAALETSRLISAATTNATVAKASGGKLFGWSCSNINAAVRYLKIYNKATAPTVGTDVPQLTLALPPGLVTHAQFPMGITFTAGISFALTTAAADADTGAVAAGEQVVNLLLR